MHEISCCMIALQKVLTPGKSHAGPVNQNLAHEEESHLTWLNLKSRLNPGPLKLLQVSLDSALADLGVGRWPGRAVGITGYTDVSHALAQSVDLGLQAMLLA